MCEYDVVYVEIMDGETCSDMSGPDDSAFVAGPTSPDRSPPQSYNSATSTQQQAQLLNVSDTSGQVFVTGFQQNSNSPRALTLISTDALQEQIKSGNITVLSTSGGGDKIQLEHAPTPHAVQFEETTTLSKTPLTISTASCGQAPSTPATPNTPKDGRIRYNWDDTVYEPILPIRCRNNLAELHKVHLGSGSKGRCVKFDGTWYTPTEFESLCGRGNSKDWKRSIRYGGRTLQTLIEEDILHPHASSCTCGTCCGDDISISGPVRLFVPYKRKPRGSTSDPLPSKFMKHRLTKEDSTEVGLPELTIHTNTLLNVNEANGGLQTPTTPKPTIFDADVWCHLDQMVNSLVSSAQQLKAVYEQTKVQVQAARDSALAQAKLHFQSDKKEALTEARMETQMLLTRTLMEVRAEKDQAVTRALALSQQVQKASGDGSTKPAVVKLCENCGREALNECNGCHQVAYCGSFCQRKDWNEHQTLCGQNTQSLVIVSEHNVHEVQVPASHPGSPSTGASNTDPPPPPVTSEIDHTE